MSLLWYFLAGVFVWNGVPHFVKGITGQTHMTPFKKVSSPVLNVVWAVINFLIGLYLLGIASGNGGLTTPWDANLRDTNLWAFIIGGALMAIYLANFWSNPKNKLPWQ